jgi:hypothetical protein
MTKVEIIVTILSLSFIGLLAGECIRGVSIARRLNALEASLHRVQQTKLPNCNAIIKFVILADSSHVNDSTVLKYSRQYRVKEAETISIQRSQVEDTQDSQ